MKEEKQRYDSASVPLLYFQLHIPLFNPQMRGLAAMDMWPWELLPMAYKRSNTDHELPQSNSSQYSLLRYKMFKTVHQANADFYFTSLGQLLLSPGCTQNRTEKGSLILMKACSVRASTIIRSALQGQSSSTGPLGGHISGSLNT